MENALYVVRISVLAALISGSAVSAPLDDHEYASVQKVATGLPDAEFLAPGGKTTVKLSALRDQNNLLLVSFFAPWCENSNNEASFLPLLNERYRKKGLKIVLVSEYGSPDEVRKFVDKYKLPFPLLMESWSKDSDVRQSTYHYRVRTKLGDTRKWGTPTNLLFVKPSNGTYAIFGEMIERELFTLLDSVPPISK
ncbi:MAG TPA: TlpA disulfide reductase family protein [Bdellovibrionota bacterium]|nr:TlpA disulfide reductase family protein [Bdellovibrionota bacterium]